MHFRNTFKLVGVAALIAGGGAALALAGRHVSAADNSGAIRMSCGPRPANWRSTVALPRKFRSCVTTVSAEPVSLPLEICIRDNGPGVSPEIAANLFDPFVTTKVSGSGLGLALVAKLIGDHGGIVECESLSRRTTFRVLMPLDTYRPPGGVPRLEKS